MKSLSNSRKALLALLALLLLFVAYRLFVPAANTAIELETEVRRGAFESLVVSAGELQAKNSEDINGPEGLRRIGLWQVKIQDLIPEGTLVEEGDYVAALDQSEISGKIRDTQAELEKAESQYLQVKLDTTLTLRAARDELLNLEFQLEQKEITLEQSRFEPPAIIRQSELDLQKGRRDLQQARENYKVKQLQAEAKMAEAQANLQQVQYKMNNFLEVSQEFTVTAPKAGMVIYIREWGGSKKKVGSSISPWDLSVATLPDLKDMLSKTYVNEVDIRRVQVGQEVRVGLDAFPDLSLKGKVVEVANVGEQRGNTDAKVFEVMVEVLESDSSVRPGMTSVNRILTEAFTDTLVVPLDAVFAEEGVQYVFKKVGLGYEKQQVQLGPSNENEAVLVAGLQAGDKLLLKKPEGADKKSIIRLDKSQETADAGTGKTD